MLHDREDDARRERSGRQRGDDAVEPQAPDEPAHLLVEEDEERDVDRWIEEEVAGVGERRERDIGLPVEPPRVVDVAGRPGGDRYADPEPDHLVGPAARADEAVQRREDEDRVIRVLVVDVGEPGAAEAELDLRREHGEADHAERERGVTPDRAENAPHTRPYRHILLDP